MFRLLLRTPLHAPLCCNNARQQLARPFSILGKARRRQLALIKRVEPDIEEHLSQKLQVRDKLLARRAGRCGLGSSQGLQAPRGQRTPRARGTRPGVFGAGGLMIFCIFWLLLPSLLLLP